MTLIAAVDLGTTTARAGLFNPSGDPVATARQQVASSHPFPGAVEQDPAALVSAVVELLQTAISDAGATASDIAALGIANQRSTVVAWDADGGEPLRPAIGWQDTRTADRVAEFVAQGIPLTTSAACSKLEWLVTTDDAVRAATSRGSLRLGTVDTWLTWALSGGAGHVTDPSNAGATGLYDLHTGDWSPGALELFGVPREPLATVVASDAVIGTTSADLLGAEIPLAARIGDQQSACVAHGIVDGAAKLTLGTSAMLDVGTGELPADAPPGTYTLPLWRREADGMSTEEFMIEGSVQTAGAAVEWMVAMGLLRSVDKLDEVADEGRPGPILVPALAGLGSPWQNPTARGLVAEVGLDTRPADVVRAAVHGIADRVTDVAEALGVSDTLLVDGGLSRSRLMVQAVADATGLAVRPARDPETTLRGAAILAGAAVGAELAPATYRDEVGPTTTDEDRRARRQGWRSWVKAATIEAD